MGEEVDVKVIKKTQETLGKIIKKPPLTEKLLRKPPFRFLHDIITNVINTTGFMKDVFTSDELNSDNIKDKESKIKFLQKVIDEVGSAVGDRLSVRPGKVVAGHEADKTNLFLQALAHATQNESESEKKIAAEPAKVKEKKTSKERAPSRDRKKEDVKNEADTNKSKVRSRSQDKPGIKKEKSSKEVKKASSSTDEPNKSKNRLSTKEKPRETHRSRKTEGDKEKRKRKRRKIPSPVKQNSSKNQIQEPEDDIINNNSDEVNGQNGLIEMGANGLNADDGGDGDVTNNRPPTVRPATSRAVTSRPLTTRPTTSTIRKINAANNLNMSPSRQVVVDDGVIRPPTSFNRLRSARPASARPPPPVLKSKRVASEELLPNLEDQSGVTNLIVENDKDNEDDDAFVTEEPTTQLDVEIEPVKQQTDINVDGEHGSLVTQILESKKDLESGSELEPNKGETDNSMLADVTRRKERDVVIREVDKMRSNIQVLTRSINPLGKMIDYLQEDVDSMQKELITWQRENQKHSQELKREQSGLEQSLEPLKVQLDDLDHTIQDQMDKIGNVKSNILRNEEKIQKLLAYHKS
uniref:TRAF3-interacting protein 1 n=1 Tax=Strigamia maritima TaxID=126957 RepID=T1JKW8_STRMM